MATQLNDQEITAAVLEKKGYFNTSPDGDSGPGFFVGAPSVEDTDGFPKGAQVISWHGKANGVAHADLGWDVWMLENGTARKIGDMYEGLYES